jgi:hypothetical protein
MGRSRRRALAALLIAAAQVVLTPSPASSASADGQFSKRTLAINGSYIPIVGAFDCDSGTHPSGDPREPGILLYAPGSASDYLWTDLSRSGAFTKTQQQLAINGTYTPVRGDFDADGCTDILWYSPNSNSDPVWWGSATGFTRGASVSVAAGYVPVPGTFSSDGRDDVFWYAPNGTERLWLATGNRTTPFRSVSTRQVAGSAYRPVHFANNVSGGGELLFHGPGSGLDPVWRFHPTSNGFVVDQTTNVSLNGSYRPAPCATKVVLHEPTAPDKLFTTNPSYVTHDLTISGSYRVGATANEVQGCVVLFHRPGTDSDQIWFSNT